jgi:hypothetical protein
MKTKFYKNRAGGLEFGGVGFLEIEKHTMIA